MDAAILAGYQGLVKDGNERQTRDCTGVAHWRRIAATSRRESSGSGSSTRGGFHQALDYRSPAEYEETRGNP